MEEGTCTWHWQCVVQLQVRRQCSIQCALPHLQNNGGALSLIKTKVQNMDFVLIFELN